MCASSICSYNSSTNATSARNRATLAKLRNRMEPLSKYAAAISATEAVAKSTSAIASPRRRSRFCGQSGVERRENAVLRPEVAPFGLMLGLGRQIEDDLEPVIDKLPHQFGMRIAAMRADMHAPDLVRDLLHRRRKDDDLRLLDVRIQQIDAVERTQDIGQRHRADEFEPRSEER